MLSNCHILFLFCVSLPSKSRKEMLDALSSKVHDEERQGEAYQPTTTESGKFAKKFYIESYGCQMNFSDSEIVASILANTGFGPTEDPGMADLILINTCSIRERAEQTVRTRLKVFEQVKKGKPSVLVGVLGCMAERLKAK